jgi:hypothetical protein
MPMRVLLAASLLFALAAATPVAGQQGAEQCSRLRAELATLDRTGSDAASLTQYRDAIDRQSEELQRTEDYAQSLSCDVDAAPECRALSLNIRRMEHNLAALQAQFSRLQQNTGDRRDIRRERVEAMLSDLGCDVSPPPAGEGQSTGLFERLFGPDETDPDYPPPSSAGPPAEPETEPDPTTTAANLRTICVRRCDGFFFPISFSTNSAGFPADEESCRTQCPSAEVELYSYDAYTQQAEDAVSTRTGEPLRSMPNAFKFRTSFSPSCSCKAGEQKAQTPSPAEEALKRLDARSGQATKPVETPPSAVPGATPTAKAPEKAPEAVAPAGQPAKKKVRVVGDPYLPEK